MLDVTLIGRRLGDLTALPVELKKEMVSTKYKPLNLTTTRLIKIINDLDGVATLDEILIQYWREFDKCWTRVSLVSTLRKLVREGVLFPVDKKKAMYAAKKELIGVFG